MGLLVKPAPVGAIKRPVRRLLLPRMTPSSCPPLVPYPLSLYAFLLGKNDRENCEERRRLSSPTKVSLKIRETLRSAKLKRKGVLSSKPLPPPVPPYSLRRWWWLCSSTAPRIVIANARPRKILLGVNTA